ncbi:MAG: NfeD family protein [candidate division KSB1 bacterium]|nr:NfeD family protein [candidate division KSB1 bacterium]MDZ7303471.1 NfeD family protein [candidate division KSB1 bacterium]MDZ7312553.1 NfeD family protein [candidate division KSB1 bacterium]
MPGWLIWLLLGLVLAILEILTPGFVFICFSFGCFVAAIVAALDFSFSWQISIFAAITFVLFVWARQIFGKLFGAPKTKVLTNVDRLIGLTATTLEEVDDQRGYVKVEGEAWSARSGSGEKLPAGIKVRILRIEGNKLVVGPEELHRLSVIRNQTKG